MKNAIIALILISSVLSCSDSTQSEVLNSSNNTTKVEQGEQKETSKNDQPIINRLEFSISIKADKEKIWNALWNDSLYRDWSGVFGEGSHYVVDNWKEGGKIMFLSSDKSGIYSVIERLVPNETIQFKHIGNVVDGKEQPIDSIAKIWTGATESYLIKEDSGFCTLIVQIDVLDEHVEFMSQKLPIALERIKKNSR